MRGFSFKRKFFNDFSKNIVLTICIVLFLFGIIIGTIVISSSNNSVCIYAENFACEIISNKENFTVIQNFSSMLIEDLTTNIILLFLALSCTSAPLILIIPVLKGINTGVIFTYLYSNYGFSGIIKTIFLFLPHTILSSLVMFYLSVYAFKCSINLFNTYILRGKRVAFYNPINIFKIFLLSSIINLVYCIVECIISIIF